MQLPISFAQAALGADIEVPTLFGKSNLHVHPGAQHGEVVTLKNLGLPGLRGGQGHQLVQLVIEIPKRLSKKQQELLREYAGTEDINVLPAQKSFFEKLKDYVVGANEEKAEREAKAPK
jgi:molecular chaperone DnaJ